MQWTVVVALLFALLVGVFAIQNAITVSLKFFSYQFETSLVVVVLGGVALGALMIGILGLLSQIKNKIQIRNLKGKIKSLEKQLNGKDEEIGELQVTVNAMEVELARFEGAHEEILAQEALQAQGGIEVLRTIDDQEEIDPNEHDVTVGDRRDLESNDVKSIEESL